jgi:cytochrome c oxidase subunit 6b
MPYCWTRYNEFLLCAKKESREDPVCQQLMYDATVICPTKAISDWEDQRSNGTFLGVQYDGPGIEFPEE